METASSPGQMTWEQVAAACPGDGATPCVGRIGSRSMKDWVWATRPQVIELFSRYVPAITSSLDSTVGGAEAAAAAARFQAAFGITQHVQGCPTYQPCFNSKFSTGMTATADLASGLPVAWGGQVSLDLEFGGGAFSVYSPMHPTMTRGLWMWRPTGHGTSAVHAYDDEIVLARPGVGTAIADVLANDWVAGQRATLANATLTQLHSSIAGVWLDTSDGAVKVADGTAAGTYAFDYRICNRASPAQCDDATVTVTVKSFAIAANPDAGTISMGKGGTAIANVLANDSLGGQAPTPGMVLLSQLSSSNPGLVLNTASGAVQVAAGTAVGAHSLTYRICERANPQNCAQTTATVAAPMIDAVNDSARGSSKVANTPLVNVLANDRFNGLVATLSQVTLTQVSIVPERGKVRLDTATGAVRVLGKTESGLYQLVYRICETASPANCDQATVSLELSGKSN